MKEIADTGLIVAFFHRNDPFHSWAVAAFRAQAPFFTCDAVPGAVHRLLVNADVYLQWNEHHLQSLDAEFSALARGRRFRSRRLPRCSLECQRICLPVSRVRVQLKGGGLADADAAAAERVA